MKRINASTTSLCLKLLLPVLVLALAGCSSTQKMRSQLNRVTKDWALAMRASQVLPVYPPTEDLQPGDVFVVQSSVARQMEVFDKRGFVSMDKQVTRLKNPAFNRFYERAYGVGVGQPQSGSAMWTTPLNDVNLAAHAPSVAFPSYSFELSQGGGCRWHCPFKVCQSGSGCWELIALMDPSQSRRASPMGFPRN